jgi:hypothetical protein
MFVNKILSNISMWGSCFEGFIARNLMGTEFNLDAWFKSYDSFF